MVFIRSRWEESDSSDSSSSSDSSEAADASSRPAAAKAKAKPKAKAGAGGRAEGEGARGAGRAGVAQETLLCVLCESQSEVVGHIPPGKTVFVLKLRDERGVAVGEGTAPIAADEQPEAPKAAAEPPKEEVLRVSAPVPGRLHRASRGSRDLKAEKEAVEAAALVEPHPAAVEPQDSQVPTAAPNDTQVEQVEQVTSPRAWKVDTFDEDVEELKRRYKAKSPRHKEKATKVSAGDFEGSPVSTASPVVHGAGDGAGKTTLAQLPVESEKAALAQPPVASEKTTLAQLPVESEKATLAQPLVASEKAMLVQPLTASEKATLAQPLVASETAALVQPPMASEKATLAQPPMASETATLAQPLVASETAALAQPPMASEKATLAQPLMASETATLAQPLVASDKAALAQQPVETGKTTLAHLPVESEKAALAQPPVASEPAAPESPPTQSERAPEQSLVVGTGSMQRQLLHGAHVEDELPGLREKQLLKARRVRTPVGRASVAAGVVDFEGQQPAKVEDFYPWGSASAGGGLADG
eukprot:Skav216172  [mRNA]  locus=scaffold2249:44439:51719:+ [translate_table: standard]